MNRLKNLVGPKAVVAGDAVDVNDVESLVGALNAREKPVVKLHERVDKLGKALLGESEAERALAQALQTIVDGGATFGVATVELARSLASFETELCELRDALATTLRDDVSTQLSAVVKADISEARNDKEKRHDKLKARAPTQRRCGAAPI